MNIPSFEHSKKAFIGGGIIMLLGLAGALVIGQISGYKAQKLLEAANPNINMLCNTIILACATILALLFTVLGLNTSEKIKLKDEFYMRIKNVALLDTLTLTATMFVFLLLNFPISESENLPNNWYQIMYYITIGVTCLVGGSMVTVIIMLYDTIVALIHIIGMGSAEHPMAELMEDELKDEE